MNHSWNHFPDDPQVKIHTIYIIFFKSWSNRCRNINDEAQQDVLQINFGDKYYFEISRRGNCFVFVFQSVGFFFYDFDFDIMLIQKYFRFSDIYTRLIYYNQNKLLSTLPLKNPCKVTGWFFRNNNIWNTRAFDLY